MRRPPVSSRREAAHRARGVAGGCGRRGPRVGAAGPDDLAAVAAGRGAGRARLRRRVPGAGPAAVSLRLADRQRGLHARPLPRRGERARDAGAVGLGAEFRAGSGFAAGRCPLSDRTEAGARIDYVSEGTHDHFHFFTAARYELEVPGAPTRVSDKIGFCLFDSFDGAGGTIQWFRPDRPWCHAPAGHAGFARMGLSPGGADRYASQREFQYVDVTGLAPGPYVLRGTANPEGHVLESDGVPDVMSETRVIPGVVADPLSADARGPVAIPLSARRRGAGDPGAARRRLHSRGPRRRTATRARTGRCASRRGGGRRTERRRCRVRRPSYTPAPGFSGDDAFSYTATDARGLESAPARVDRARDRAAAPAPVPAIAAVRAACSRSSPPAGSRAARSSCASAAVPRRREPCAGRITARTRARRLASRRFSEAASRPRPHAAAPAGSRPAPGDHGPRDGPRRARRRAPGQPRPFRAANSRARTMNDRPARDHGALAGLPGDHGDPAASHRGDGAVAAIGRVERRGALGGGGGRGRPDGAEHALRGRHERADRACPWAARSSHGTAPRPRARW